MGLRLCREFRNSSKGVLRLLLIGLGVLAVLALAYVAFMKKYYPLHEEYLASLKK